jgi:hypothetical protein
MRVKSWEVATYAPASFQSAHIWDIPIAYNPGRMVFRKQIKSFAAVLGKQYSVPLPRLGLTARGCCGRGVRFHGEARQNSAELSAIKRLLQQVRSPQTLY